MREDDGALDEAPNEVDLPAAMVVLHFAGVTVSVDALMVERVVDRSPITPLPRAPAHVPGLVLVGASALPLFDLASFLGVRKASRGTVGHRMVVCAVGPFEVALLAEDLTMVTSEKLEPRPPRLTPGPHAERYCLAELTWRDEAVLYLDLPAVLEAARARG